MFAITKAHPARGVWKRSIPEAAGPQHGEVLIRVDKAGICGTDLHIYLWDAWSAGRVAPPLVIGHEFFGYVEAIGPGVSGLTRGDRVSAECHVTCERCHACRTGHAHLCPNTEIVGVDRPGCFTEYVTVPQRNVWRIDERIPDALAAVMDPIGNAMHTVEAAKPYGADLLITGAGPIGLFATAIAADAGAKSIIVLEPNAQRAQFAAELGADLVLDPGEPDTLERIAAATDRKGPDAVLEMSGHPDALEVALSVVSYGGRLALLGLPSRKVEIDLAERIVMRGVSLQGVTGRRMFATWYQVDALLRRKAGLFEKVITHVLPAHDFERGFKLMEQGACGKVVLDFRSPMVLHS